MSYKPELKVYKLEEAGFVPAMLGLSLNRDQGAKTLQELDGHITDYISMGKTTWSMDIVSKMLPVAKQLKGKDKGHNKFLESIYCWFMVIAPRYMWQQMDTYRLSTKQSQATMHLCKTREVGSIDFEEYDVIPEALDKLNEMYHKKDMVRWKRHLPEGFMQARMWVMNYKCIRNILDQRSFHKLPDWKNFSSYVSQLVNNPEFL